MQTFKTSYRGLSLLVDLNWDRALYFGFLIIALTAGAWIGASRRSLSLSRCPPALYRDPTGRHTLYIGVWRSLRFDKGR